jgi:hypothetical protein
MESVYHIVAIRVNETSWAHVWWLHSDYLGTGCDNTFDLQETTKLTLFYAGTPMILSVIYQLQHYVLHSFHPANELAFSQLKQHGGESQIQRLASTNQTDRYIEHLDTL